MYEILIKGVEVMKHGRNGRPKQRMLYCDADMTKLSWRAVTKVVGTRHSLDSTFHLTSGYVNFEL